jgi:hypothetical protein
VGLGGRTTTTTAHGQQRLTASIQSGAQVNPRAFPLRHRLGSSVTAHQGRPHTGGRPPVSAWHGPLRLVDADLLYDAVHELGRGFDTPTFRAPGHLGLLCDYGHWCDALMALAGYRVHLGEPARRAAGSFHLEQACLPYLHVDW